MGGTHNGRVGGLLHACSGALAKVLPKKAEFRLIPLAETSLIGFISVLSLPMAASECTFAVSSDKIFIFYFNVLCILNIAVFT